MNDNILNIGTKLRQALPAQPCLLCGVSTHDDGWCPACDRGLPYLSPSHCPVCALPTPDRGVCGRCLKRAPHFDRSIAVFAYAFPIDRLVHALKYGEQLALAHALAQRLAQRIEYRPDLVLPMPLHPARLRERGFNQSLELARSIARILGLPLHAHVVQRIRDTTPQSTLPWKARKRNMRNAFACDGSVAGKHVAIVDDVMTSGTTLNELARTLRRAEASEISTWVVARTLHRG